MVGFGDVQAIDLNPNPVLPAADTYGQSPPKPQLDKPARQKVAWREPSEDERKRAARVLEDVQEQPELEARAMKTAPLGTSAKSKRTLAVAHRTLHGKRTSRTMPVTDGESSTLNLVMQPAMWHLLVFAAFAGCSIGTAAQDLTPVSILAIVLYVVLFVLLLVAALMGSRFPTCRPSTAILTSVHIAVVVVDGIWMSTIPNDSLGDAWCRVFLQAGILQVVAMACYPSATMAWQVSSLLLTAALIATQLATGPSDGRLKVLPNVALLLATVTSGAQVLGRRPLRDEETVRGATKSALQELVIARTADAEYQALLDVFKPVLDSSWVPDHQDRVDVADRVEAVLVGLWEVTALPEWCCGVLTQAFEQLVLDLHKFRTEPTNPLKGVDLDQASEMVKEFVMENLVEHVGGFDEHLGANAEPNRSQTVRSIVAKSKTQRLQAPSADCLVQLGTPFSPQQAAPGTFVKNLAEMTEPLKYMEELATEGEASRVPFLDRPARSLSAIQTSMSTFVEEWLGKWNLNLIESSTLLQRPFVPLARAALQPLAVHLDFDEGEGLTAFLRDMELRYHNSLPYHNATHAADVLNSMVYWLTLETTPMGTLKPIEKLTALVAAISHDVGHDGRANRYHTVTETALARLYNDQSPLENMHCAITFNVLRSDGTSFLEDLEPAEWSYFRSGMVSMILDTDLAKHLQAVKNFEATFDSQERGEVLSDQAKRKQLLSFYLKASDVGASAKQFSVHAAWSTRIIAEFFAQGDLERDQGLPCSPFCDRETTVIADSQKGFFDFIVVPLYRALNGYLMDLVVEAEVHLKIQQNRLFWMGFDSKLFDSSKPEGNVEKLVALFNGNFTVAANPSPSGVGVPGRCESSASLVNGRSPIVKMAAKSVRERHQRSAIG